MKTTTHPPLLASAIGQTVISNIVSAQDFSASLVIQLKIIVLHTEL